MSETIQFLNRVQIASPCPMTWDQLEPLEGGEVVRYCGECRLNVFNFSAMTALDAEALLRRHAGRRLCATYFQREDGTIMTKDCPSGARVARMWRAARRRSAAVRFAALSGAIVALPLAAHSFDSKEPTRAASRPATKQAVKKQAVKKQAVKKQAVKKQAVKKSPILNQKKVDPHVSASLKPVVRSTPMGEILAPPVPHGGMLQQTLGRMAVPRR
jgi:hypothetical protein